MSNEDNKEVHIGGLVGKSIGGKIENCHVSGKIIINSGETDLMVGGLVGYAKDTEIIDSSSDIGITIEENNKFDELKEIIVKNINDDGKLNELIGLIEEMKEKKSTPNYLKAYTNFISSSADHMTLISSFIPFLTKFINKN